VEAHSTVLRALGGPALLEHLARGVVGQEEGDPACRCLAAAALEEALTALRQLDALPGQEVRFWGGGGGGAGAAVCAEGFGRGWVCGGVFAGGAK
jgi:hypothetical protein